MMDSLLQQVLRDQTAGFALVDRELRVEQFSDLFCRFAFPGVKVDQGMPLLSIYPELVGQEQEMQALLAPTDETLKIPGINRTLAGSHTCFLDLTLSHFHERDTAARLLFTVWDRSEHYGMKQRLAQQKHELALIKSAFLGAKDLQAGSILGDSPPIMRLKELVFKIAKVPGSTVLLLGESGTGKSHVARVIHQMTFEPGAPFIEFNCAAIPENLLEAELFGYEKGAFTHAVKSKKGLIEEADGGTLFLDEIGELPPNLQAKLLHFLESRSFRRIGSNQQRQVRVRCIAASNRDLQAAVHARHFREDLFFRLNVVKLDLPPLRELGDDILRLADHYLSVYSQEFKKKVNGFTANARRMMASYRWPGNVRELRNTIERAMIFCDGATIQASDLSLPGSPAIADSVELFQLPDGGIQLEALERSLLLQALARSDGNKTQAAALLGLSRDTFRYRLEKYRIAGGKSQ